MLLSVGGGAVHPPEHEAGDHVAEQEGHAAREPLGSRELVPGMTSGNREPQRILGELFHDYGGEQVSENTNDHRRDIRFHSESALDKGVGDLPGNKLHSNNSTTTHTSVKALSRD